MDNSPAWDVALGSVDPSGAPSFVRVDQQHVADPSQRPTDDDYARYAALVAEIAANDFGLGSFAVYEPGMTAMLAWADGELAQLADALDEPAIAAEARARSLRVSEALVAHLWDESTGRFVVEDANTAVRHAPDVVSAYLPLLCRLPDPIADTLRSGLEQRFDTPYGIPTVSPHDPSFDHVKYWRGPVWANVNWLLDGPLGGRLRAPTLELIDREGAHEYFDPETGAGLGVDDFTWTAAVALDWTASR